jgi:hypothetical protein
MWIVNCGLLNDDCSKSSSPLEFHDQKNNKVKSVKDEWRINKFVAVKLSKELHLRFATLLHTILIHLQPCLYGFFQDLVTSREKKNTIYYEREIMKIQAWRTCNRIVQMVLY